MNENDIFYLTVHGNIYIKKNSRRIVQRSGRFISLPSKRYSKWETDAVDILGRQWGKRPPIDRMVNLCLRFYLQDKRKRDLSNLYQGVEDALQKSGVIEDDYLVVGHDGSGRYFDASNPRIEISLTVVPVGLGFN